MSVINNFLPFDDRINFARNKSRDEYGKMLTERKDSQALAFKSDMKIFGDAKSPNLICLPFNWR